jgi:hypothetical protein
VKKTIKILLALALVPLCIAMVKVLINQLTAMGEISPHQFYFLLGFVAYLAIQAIFFRPIRTYVFGHELTHAIWSVIFGGEIKDFKVSKHGGSVLLTKTNFIINLAPYFFPIYTVIVLLIYYGLGIFIDVKPYVSYMLFLLGFTLAFHLALTFYALATKQPDVVKTGVMFSLVIILLINVIVIIMVLKVVTPEKIHLGDFFKQSYTLTIKIWEWIIIKTEFIITKIYSKIHVKVQ